MTEVDEPTTETRLNVSLRDIGTALVFLSRLPVPEKWQDQTRTAAATWAYPVVGALIGLIVGVVLWVMIAIGLPAGPAAAIALGIMAIITGALHEDGFADCADGLGGGSSRESCLAIMRDSRTGAFGTLATGLSLLARWSALTLLATAAPVVALILAGALARMPMVLVMVAMRPARTDGASASVGRPTVQSAGIALALSLLLAIVLTGFWGFLLVAAALIAAVPLVYFASRLIDGQTGDILGGIEQSAEIVLLTLLAAILI